MKELSYPNHVVPKLSVDGAALTSKASALLDEKQLADPASLLAKIYWDVVEVLVDMLDLLEAANERLGHADRKRRAVLRCVEILMLRCSSQNDYLRKLLDALAPPGASKELEQCRAAIEARLGRGIRVPINKTKHDGFTLASIVLVNGVASVPGFVVYGPLPDRVTGPLSRSTKHGAGTPEGYSLPLFMRRVLLLIFEMADLAHDQLLKWDAIAKGVDAAKAHNPNDERINALPDLLKRLNALPQYGFEGEQIVRTPMFQIKDGTLTVQLVPTKKLTGTVRVEFQIPAVRAGSSLQMPYWRP